MSSNLKVNTILPSSGDIVSISGIASVTSSVSIASSCTATTFYGSGANLTSLPAQATIANNANNRIITGGSGVNLNGESTLTYNGTDTFELQPASATPAIFIGDSNRTGAGQGLAQFRGNWNGTTVARITFDTGVDTTNKDDGFIRFDTAPSGGLTERVRITSGGQVRIANTTETVSSGADDLVVGTTSGERGITILSGTSSNGNIYFGDTDTSGVGNRMGSIRYVHDGNYMRFSTNGNQERLRITSSGHVSITSGNLEFANGAGVDFSNVPDGSRSVSSNLLNDYEEGTWTPTMYGHSTGTGSSTIAGEGWYVKTGGTCTILVRFVNKNGTVLPASNEQLRITLPFSAKDGPGNQTSAVPFTYNVIFNTDRTYTFITQNASAFIRGYSSRNNATWQPWHTADWRNSQIYMYVNMTYLTA